MLWMGSDADAIVSSVKHATDNAKETQMATKTRIVDASNIARIASHYRARLGEEGVDADFVASCEEAFEEATMQRFDADLEGRVIKIQPGRAYASPLEGLMALMADAAVGKPGTYAARYAVSETAHQEDDGEVSAETIEAIMAYDLAEVEVAEEAPCGACDRVARYGTKCREHSR